MPLLSKIRNHSRTLTLTTMLIGSLTFLCIQNNSSIKSGTTDFNNLYSPTTTIETKASSNQALNSQKQLKIEETYPVTKVVDGDTIKVLINGEIETVRLIGIDTPESVHPSKPVECFGIESSNKLKSLLNDNKVILKTDISQGNQDKYNRLLRYVFLEDGTNINLQMISEGYAFEYTYNSPYYYQQTFKTAEIQAREKQVGLWNNDSCNGEREAVLGSDSTTATITSTTLDDSNSTNQTYPCDCYISCSQIATCEEAMYLLNTCGCTERDGDSDGLPCEQICTKN